MAGTGSVRTGAGPDELGTVSDHLEDCWDEPESSAPSCPDLEALQGAWRGVSGRRAALFLICGNHLTAHFDDGAIYMGTLSLDGDGRPRTMDVAIDERPGPHKSQVAQCLYELAGDTLRWCTAGPGQPRPREFAHAGDARFLSIEFRRLHGIL